MVKKMIAVVLVLGIFLIPLSVGAAPKAKQENTGDSYQIMWNYAKSCSTTLSVSATGTASSRGTLTGFSGQTTDVSIYLYLQQYKGNSWSTIGSWSKSFNTYKGTLQQSKSVTKGYKYRVMASYYAKSGSLSENIVQYSATIQY